MGLFWGVDSMAEFRSKMHAADAAACKVLLADSNKQLKRCRSLLRTIRQEGYLPGKDGTISIDTRIDEITEIIGDEQ